MKLSKFAGSLVAILFLPIIIPITFGILLESSKEAKAEVMVLMFIVTLLNSFAVMWLIYLAII